MSSSLANRQNFQGDRIYRMISSTLLLTIAKSRVFYGNKIALQNFPLRLTSLFFSVILLI
jgi:hypothetical protein